MKRILVPLDESEWSTAASERACAISLAHGARVEGLVILDLPEILGSDLPYQMWMLPDALVLGQKRKEDAQRRIDRIKERFASLCAEKGVAHWEMQANGVPSDCIRETAAMHDLVVIGQRTFFHFETDAEAEDSLDKLLGAATAPVLAVPKQNAAKEWKTVLIAFDGSPNSANALREFARLAQPYAFEVTVLTVTEDEKHGKFLVDDACAYLAAHGIDNVTPSVASGEHPMAILEQEYLENADLIVCGIHSRRFLKDLFIGSLPKRLIKLGEKPLLLA